MEVAAFKDKETGQMFYMEIPADRASGAGLREKSWGEMNNLRDDQLREAADRKIENQLRFQEAQNVEIANNLFKTHHKHNINTTLSVRGFKFDESIYGGVIAAMTAVKMAQSGRSFEGDGYEQEWNGQFSNFAQWWETQIDQKPELLTALQGATSNADARDKIIQLFYAEEPQNAQLLEAYFKKYINIYNRR